MENSKKQTIPGGSLVDERLAKWRKQRAKGRGNSQLVDLHAAKFPVLKGIVRQLLDRVEELERIVLEGPKTGAN